MIHSKKSYFLILNQKKCLIEESYSISTLIFDKKLEFKKQMTVFE